MTFKVALKQIRQHDNRKEFYRRLEEWQKANHTTGMPYAHELGLERIAYSCGTYGINGTMYRDIESGKIIGVPETSCNIYIA